MTKLRRGKGKGAFKTYRPITIGLVVTERTSLKGDEKYKVQKLIEEYGVRLLGNGDLFIHPDTLGGHVPEERRRGRTDIRAMLIKLDGVHAKRLRIDGKSLRGLVVPKEHVDY